MANGMVENGQEKDHGPEDPLWYKDAILYEVHVRAFSDSDEDGIGDFRGLTGKLDYLKDLGVTAIWLLPFYPSPLRDDGYDIADYEGVHPSYGTIGEFRAFLREAHRLGMQVITELVMNHTSDLHPWFQRARLAAPGSRHRDYYVWSDSQEKYADARIIFKDFEVSNWTWDRDAKQFYWHRFYSHQPDLNFDNPRVHREMLRLVDFWLGMGVDGLRLDAIPYLFEREGTNCENLPETHAFLRSLRRHVGAKFRNRMLLAEANQWPEDAVAYFGNGDECHMAFQFPVMPRMFLSMRMEDRFPLLDILQQTPAIPENAQWAVFLRNHDELTLEMVTDEERDYMYRVYAQERQARLNLGIRRRLAPLLDNHRPRIELMNGLLFSLPGTPVLYYGDEIGMGDNIYLGDRNGVRTPMQWSGDRNAGFSRANPQRLYLPVIIDPEYHFEKVNVESQLKNRHSLLWWMKRLIALRKNYKAFGRGSLKLLYPRNPKILAFLREYENEKILVIANLSRFTQYVELDLREYAGMVPVELFGRTQFPPIGETSYLMTLSHHAFYWFALERAQAPVEASAERKADLPSIRLRGEWDSLFEDGDRSKLEALLPRYLAGKRWFAGKARTVQGVELLDAIEMPGAFAAGIATGGTAAPGATAAPAAAAAAGMAGASAGAGTAAGIGTSMGTGAGGGAGPGSSRSSFFVLVRVDYTEGDSENYFLTLGYVTGEEAEKVRASSPTLVLARLTANGREGLLIESMAEESFCESLLRAIERRRRFGREGEVQGRPTASFRALRGDPAEPLPVKVTGGEQSNTSMVYGDRFILKLFRKIDEGVNPDLEIGRHLSEKVRYPNTPLVAGSIEYRRPDAAEPMTLAILQQFVPNEGDAWRYTLSSLADYFDRVQAARHDLMRPDLRQASVVDLARADPDPKSFDLIGPYLSMVQLLAERTAQLHIALAADARDPNFAPEPFGALYQRSLYQSMRTLTVRSMELLRRRLASLPDAIRGEGEEILRAQPKIEQKFQRLLQGKISGRRIRVHGDYHLGQVLFTGKDFLIIDFEGEPAHSLGERRIKRSALRDVAGMLRSFHYAAYTALATEAEPGGVAHSADGVEPIEPWARWWYMWVSAAFLRRYLERTAGSGLLPSTDEELKILFDCYLMEKAVYELAYELNNRPDWVRIPIQGIQQVLTEVA